ncbi:hypothetical protein GCM10011313_19950 [Mycetocola zhadangensis]|nr:hypothetical protein GCM10011313_19950 [Mycetocola zhadangensis]
MDWAVLDVIQQCNTRCSEKFLQALCSISPGTTAGQGLLVGPPDEPTPDLFVEVAEGVRDQVAKERA